MHEIVLIVLVAIPIGKIEHGYVLWIYFLSLVTSGLQYFTRRLKFFFGCRTRLAVKICHYSGYPNHATTTILIDAKEHDTAFLSF
jgi:hypothetical protein